MAEKPEHRDTRHFEWETYMDSIGYCGHGWTVKGLIQHAKDLHFFCKDMDQVMFQNETSKCP